MEKEFEPHKFYKRIDADANEMVIFETFMQGSLIYANDIYNSSNVNLIKNWRVAVYTRAEVQEIDINNYPEYMI